MEFIHSDPKPNGYKMASIRMKIKSWIWAACMALVLGSVVFVACEDKSNVGGGGGSESGGGGGGGSASGIVGTWKSVAGSTMYGDETYILTFNADKTGKYQYIEDEPDEVEEFDFTYTFNTSTNTGKLVPTYYSDEYGTEFKVVWKSKDKVEIYTRDAYYSEYYNYDYYNNYNYYEYYGYYYDYYYEEYYGYDGWELLGTFERQGSSGGGGEQGGGGGGQAGNSIVGSWKYGPSASEYLVLTFNSSGSCSYTYVYYDESEILTGTYTYDASTGKGRMTLRDPEYTEETVYLDFRIEWQSNNSANVYAIDEGKEGLLGLFTRI